jgi:hypothetical protein
MCHDAVGGAVWHFLHYVLGLEQLGFRTYYVEWTDSWLANPENASADPDFPRVLIADVMRDVGLGDRWICRADHLGSDATFGPMRADDLPALFETASVLINVSGTHVLNEDHQRCQRRVYLETDPGIPQIRIAEGDARLEAVLDAHTHFFTFAENIGNADCLLPTNRFPFRTTRPAVALSEWAGHASSGADGRLTTITKWEKRRKDIKFRGELYRWSKSEQFLNFIDLPARASMPIELAVSGASAADLKFLHDHGWRLAAGLEISSSLSRYRDYVLRSAGEFTVAKDQYVRLRTGWFSDRSACYLAAGRPVITQDTGFSCTLPTGEGLFPFSTMDDILAAVDAIRSNPARHQDAARAIGEQFFDARKVIGDIVLATGLEVPAAS